jgi:hypothetical protein
MWYKKIFSGHMYDISDIVSEHEEDELIKE